jgi:hypothetical protein
MPWLVRRRVAVTTVAGAVSPRTRPPCLFWPGRVGSLAFDIPERGRSASRSGRGRVPERLNGLVSKTRNGHFRQSRSFVRKCDIFHAGLLDIDVVYLAASRHIPPVLPFKVAKSGNDNGDVFGVSTPC